MKYLCLIYGEEKTFDAMPKADFDALIDAHFVFDDALREGGQLIVCEALEASAVATCIRMRNGKMSATDGPFAETKEQLVGFYLIEARDLNEAMQVAGRIPSAPYATIEVRPIRTHTPS